MSLYPSCSAYCRGEFHTTQCEAKRGVLKPPMRGETRHLSKLLYSYILGAVGRGLTDPKEILLNATTELYQDAVLAQYLSAHSEPFRQALDQAKERIAELEARPKVAREASVGFDKTYIKRLSKRRKEQS